MLKLQAEQRKEKGTSFSRKLRINNKFPGILYGINKNSILLILDHNSVFNLQKKSEFYQENLLLLIDNETYTVKVHNIQRHVFKSKLLHIDFIYA
ncbi:50S ribosomal protein L25 [Buchnera aphidicola (Macrosiphoniella sanborni)]|uniref:Large ribosomal subunit protein bL25 n=1 Tax=Buchnera aphidicola (Macrosiphoniella sanborni) TaxID=1241865 RepID=A0A4D6YCJ4_9GAMM|nr:50S ribosomal protein L25 [Buchnera aphidicola]QCI23694.1 50S ribosomal protein L25 [Buchnera aphidicola (Macrosiphoniella sanborni)]